MRALLIATLLFLAACSSTRRFAYNYHEQRTEAVAPGDELTWNIYENEWRYAAPGARPIFNYYEKRWEYPR